MLEFLSEQPEHGPLVDSLVDLSFGPGRHAKTAFRLRDGVDHLPELAFVALEDGVFRASLRFWPVVIGGRWPALLLGPLAVDPAERGRGIGIGVMRHALARAAALGHERVVLVGDEKYYARVGFDRASAAGLTLPGPVDPRRVLALALTPGAMDGVSGTLSRPS